jgi:predicted transposase YbfD/YdcC
VSLFAVNSGLILAQRPVEDKSNEITAIPKILGDVDIQGAIITIDAMGCQKNIAKQICNEGADYVLALKGNAGLIHDEIMQYFKEAEEAGYEYLEHTHCKQEDLGHGRTVLRTVRCVQDVEWIPQLNEWEKLKGLIEVVSQRTEKGKASIERRYYITSLDANAEKLERIIRSHWGIENNLHWQLDVNFAEDDSPINTGNAGENLATFRRMTLNILGSGKGLLDRRRNAAWNEDYLTELVKDFFIKSL